MLAGAGVAGHLTLVFLSIALMWGLDALFDSLVWASVIVAVLWAIIAAVLAVMGRSQIKKAPGMDRTVDTAKRVPDALKETRDDAHDHEQQPRRGSARRSSRPDQRQSARTSTPWARP